MGQRVVITGLGLCTPAGRGAQDFWQNLLAGRSGIGPITLFDAATLPVRIGGEVKGFDPLALLNTFPEASGEKDRKIWLGLDAAAGAVADAGVRDDELAAALLFVGVSLEAFFLEHVAPAARANDLTRALAEQALLPTGAGRLQTPLDQLTQIICEHYQLRGRAYTNCSACAAGAQAIGEGFRQLRAGPAELALAGATDSTLNPLGLAGFSLLHILSTENDQPEKACRPFDATRQGTVLSEGAAFVLLETLEHARRRGARIYAEVLGYGSSLDAYRVTDPEPAGRGAILSMRNALADAGVDPPAVAGLNAHGTGTPKNDVAETRAIKTVFGDHARRIPITANKSMTGHLIAASGAVEAAASALTLWSRQMPPTINLEHPDPECDLDYVPEGCRDFDGPFLLSNSFGFGGQNAALLFGSPPL